MTEYKHINRSEAQVIQALQEAHGVVCSAARILGLKVQALQKRIRNNERLQKARDDAREMEVDYLHAKMLDLVEKNDYRAIEFLMRKLGRNQGFGEVQDINIHSTNVNQNFDVSKLSEEEQEKLYELINKSTVKE